MLDEMKLKLGSKFMRKMVAKFVANMIYKKTGYKVEINLDELNVDFVDGDATIKTSLELKLDKVEFTKIMKDVDMF